MTPHDYYVLFFGLITGLKFPDIYSI